MPDSRELHRLSWPEMKRFWEDHASIRAPLAPDDDSDALHNVCVPDAPERLNEYYAATQRRVYDLLLKLAGQPASGRAALDIGCGTGRWCRALRERGFSVTGIDLQPGLVQRNRVRYPEMSFECVPIQDYAPGRRFALVSSVTVLAHNPFEQHRPVLERMRSLVEPGGHALVLENVRDQAPHMFSRTTEGWRDEFEAVGFRLVALRKYDYSPALRSLARLTAAFSRVSARQGRMRPDASAGGDASDGRGRPSRFAARLKALAASVDDRLEPALVSRQVRVSNVHTGFLFRAV